jgi:hypothetical protein
MLGCLRACDRRAGRQQGVAWQGDQGGEIRQGCEVPIGPTTAVRNFLKEQSCEVLAIGAIRPYKLNSIVGISMYEV